MIDEKKLIEEIGEYIISVYGCDINDIIAFQTNNESKSAYIVQGICEAIDFIDEQPKVGDWIPCSERLPEVEDLHEISIEDCMCYLIQRRCGVMDVAHYIKVYGEPYFEAHCIKFNDVIAWMPLPKPYKEG